ncbi:hypothetical protein COHA_000380 [Chlorella ohadii]|uniref:Alpha-galactosidase n=1 Tax=Chlorella ohadii TaxID=2649997 RepID=A0AAD5E325_9CHLO|nr:hypothetical protein COHA_000380 [Chlorella ohadii]
MRLALVLLSCCALGALALDNGQGLRPAMGFNTWNTFATNIDEELIKNTADLMIQLGLKDVGYNYVNLDDAWSAPARQGGRLVADPQRFPSGIRALSDYVHARGLKFGIYGDAGALTCAGYPGSRGFEKVDAQTWAEWGIDYLKYDNCWAPASDWVIDRYVAMRDALNATGRPILYSMCEWGVADPWTWAATVGNSWRATEVAEAQFEIVACMLPACDGKDIEANWESILKLLDYSHGLARYAKPGAWNDLDMLEVGVGKLTVGEQRTHFALWALLKSPLIIGADLRKISPDSLAILKAQEVIAVNQDPLGVAGDLIWQIGQSRIYAGPLAGGARAVVLLNLHHTGGQYLQSNITVHWRQIGLPAGAAAAVRDLYAERDLGTFTDSFSASVTAHDVRVLRITPLERSADLDSWRPWHQQPMLTPTDEAPPSFADLLPSGNAQLPGNRLPEEILAAQLGRRMGKGEGEQFTMVAEA